MYQVALILTAVGALNWGLVALLDLDLVITIFGEGSILTTIVYVVVAASALYVLFGYYTKKTS